MQRKSPPLPTKWYLATCVVALCLATGLMTIFAIKVGKQPAIPSNFSESTDVDDQAQTVATVSKLSTRLEPKEPASTTMEIASVSKPSAPAASNPPDAQHEVPEPAQPNRSNLEVKQPLAKVPPTNPSLDSAAPENPAPQADEPSLWSLIVSPELIAGAFVVVVLGSMSSARKAWLNRTRIRE